MSVNAARRQGRVRAKNDLSARLRHSSFQHSCNKRISKARRVAGERTRSLVYYLIIFRTIGICVYVYVRKIVYIYMCLYVVCAAAIAAAW